MSDEVTIPRERYKKLTAISECFYFNVGKIKEERKWCEERITGVSHQVRELAKKGRFDRVRDSCVEIISLIDCYKTNEQTLLRLGLNAKTIDEA